MSRSRPGRRYWTNPVTEVAVAAGAWVEHTRIQRESESAYHVGLTHVDQQRDSHYRVFSLAMGGALARHNLHVRLNDENIETLMYGLYLTRGDQVADNHTAIYHDQPNCRSWEVYKGILDGRSRAVFNGKVFVKPEAQKTDAKQTNRNLLLSDGAPGEHQAAARDLRRRREVHPRRHGGPARRAWPGSTPGAAASRRPPPTASSPTRSRPRWWTEVALAPVREELDRLVRAIAWAASEPAMTATATPALDVERLRQDFPILAQRVRGKPLVYLDNAATSQKPRAVIDAVTRFYAAENANIHRGVHYLSERASAAYDEVRERVARFLHAATPSEIVFTRGTTEAINLVAQSWGRTALRPGDEILITGMEHHSNIVPWQLVAAQTGRHRPCRTDHRSRRARPRRRSIGCWATAPACSRVVHVSNALGTINPGARARGAGARAGRRDAGRRRAVGAPSAGGRPGARVRLLCLLRAQGVRTDRRRGALRPHRAARVDAALAGRRAT